MSENELEDSMEQRGPAPEKSKIEKIEEYLFYLYQFRSNRITCMLEFSKDAGQTWDEFQDENLRDLVVDCKKKKFTKPKEDIEDILKSSIVPKYNPIQEYYEALPPVTRGAIQRLADCIVLDSSIQIEINGRTYRQLFDEYFAKWLTACYLCNMGIKPNDVMFILIGAQGRFKTSFLNHLTPKSMPKYSVCAHINPSLTDYNTANYLAEKMFINVDDQMETIFGKDYNSMKAIISAPDVTSRKLYTSTSRKRPRIANFCGSVNEAGFLRDSNNRRYLCFAIEDIKPEYSAIDMDEVWAEVRDMAERTNAMYVFGKEDYAIIDTMNRNFEAPSEEGEALIAIFSPSLTDDTDTYYCTFSEILQMLRRHTGNTQLKPYNLQTAMRRYRFVRKPARKERFGHPVYLYPIKLTSAATENMALQMAQYK